MVASSEKTDSRLVTIVPLAVLGLGVVNFALGFVPQFAVLGTGTNFFAPGGSAVSVALLFAAGVLAGIGSVPSQRSMPTVVFSLSLAGVATLLFQALGTGRQDTALGGGTFAVLVLGLVQTALALASVIAASHSAPPVPQAPTPPADTVDSDAYVADPENTSYGLPGYGTPGNGGQGSGGLGSGGDSNFYNPGYRDLSSGAPAQIRSSAQGLGSPLASVGPIRSRGNGPAATGYDSPYGRTSDVPHEPKRERPDSKWAAD